ncbi:GntR family transcriptional regulator [Oxalicibacterium flavum]|uniref:GntR family transcriptional regulator n=1 Tax=Oxalicibacterium flavum TaxID=179467 RepID=A0A8J2XXF5_9BURK|nr:DoxX family protein [Oxalicibacterium flavum]GGC00709.1 GntR family transcriptional regulator [Oxalicibacterium flavum]
MGNTDDLGKLLLRLALGVLILLHGIAKVLSGPGFVLSAAAGAGLPSAIGYLVYVGEVLAPVLLLLGVWSRLAAVIVAGNMLFAIYLVHMKQLWSLNSTGGWSLELQGMFLATAVAIALLGAGRFSIGGRGGRWN